MAQPDGERVGQRGRGQASARRGTDVSGRDCEDGRTSQSQVQRFAAELKEAVDDQPYEPPGEPVWRPTLTAFEAMEERAVDAGRQRDQVISDAAAIAAENRALRVKLGMPEQEVYR